jgi:hypothetical protein
VRLRGFSGIPEIPEFLVAWWWSTECLSSQLQLHKELVEECGVSGKGGTAVEDRWVLGDCKDLSALRDIESCLEGLLEEAFRDRPAEDGVLSWLSGMPMSLKSKSPSSTSSGLLFVIRFRMPKPLLASIVVAMVSEREKDEQLVKKANNIKDDRKPGPLSSANDGQQTNNRLLPLRLCVVADCDGKHQLALAWRAEGWIADGWLGLAEHATGMDGTTGIYELERTGTTPVRCSGLVIGPSETSCWTLVEATKWTGSLEPGAVGKESVTCYESSRPVVRPRNWGRIRDALGP